MNAERTFVSSFSLLASCSAVGERVGIFLDGKGGAAGDHLLLPTPHVPHSTHRTLIGCYVHRSHVPLSINRIDTNHCIVQTVFYEGVVEGWDP